MQTGFRGTFAISWMQTEVDGQGAAPVGSLRAGQCWSWSGEAFRVDGPQDLLQLSDAQGAAALRRRAGRAVRRVLAAAEVDSHRFEIAQPESEPVVPDQSLVLTDGRRIWMLRLIDAGRGRPPFVGFVEGVPPRRVDLWIVSVNLGTSAADNRDPGGVVCFTPGTMILTETGPVEVEALAEGDRVQTKDNGCQPILWIGRRRVTGARMRALPHLAPVRLHEDALDRGVPNAGLLVSPDHRLVLRGSRAKALFNADEVLVGARELVDDRLIRIERSLAEVTYLHLLLPRHEIVFANGVETDSFHPESAGPDACTVPDLAGDTNNYGGYARRVLTKGEAAILRHDIA